MNNLDCKLKSYLGKETKNLKKLNFLGNTKVDKKEYFTLKKFFNQDVNNFKISQSYFEKRLGEFEEFRKEYTDVFQEIGESKKIIEALRSLATNMGM